MRVSAELGTQSRSVVRFTDCPQVGAVIPRSSPLCSIQITADDCNGLIRQLVRLETPSSAYENTFISKLYALGYSTLAIANQLKLLWQKFNRCKSTQLP